MTRRDFLLDAVGLFSATLTALRLAAWDAVVESTEATPEGAAWLPVARWVGQWFERNPQERRVSIRRQGRLYRAERFPGGWRLMELCPDGRRLIRHTFHSRWREP